MKRQIKTSATSTVKAESWVDWSVVSFRVRGEAKHIVPKILNLLSILGSMGASRKILVEDVPPDSSGTVKGGDTEFFFDGDGADKIEDIEVDGQPIDTSTMVYSSVKRKVLAAHELVKEGSYNISSGGNSFRFSSPEEAYEKASEFIKNLKHDGYKFDPRGTMADQMDVFKKGSTEISVSVRNQILNIDLW